MRVSMDSPPQSAGRTRILELNGHMGDVVMALPVLRAYRRANPLDRLHFLAQEKYHAVLTGNRSVDFVRPLGALKGSPRISLADFSGRPWAAKWRHVVDAMADACGVQVEDRAYRMVTPGDDDRWADQEAARLGRFACVHSSSAMDSKDWPLDRMSKAAERLREQGLRVVQVGGEADPRLDVPELVDHRGALSITRSAALMARAALFLGPDSGPMHLSRGVRDVPAVVLWGAGSPVTTGLPGRHVANLDPARLCGHGGRPCHSRCDWTQKCVSTISEDAVWAACRRFVSKAQDPIPDISVVLVNWNSWTRSTHPMVSKIDRTLLRASIELVLVDNGSEGDRASIRSLARPYPIRKTLWDTNRGLPCAWNEASRLATGPLVAFMNTDLDLAPGWDAFALDFFGKNPSASVLGLSSNEPPMAFGPGLSRERLPLEAGKTTRCHHMIGSCFIVRREALDRVGPFDERYTPAYCEDTDWFLKACLMGEQVWHHAGFAHHRGHEVTVGINRMDARPVIQRNDAYFLEKWKGAEVPALGARAPVQAPAEAIA